MYSLFLSLHVLSAVALGFYMLFPLLALSMKSSEDTSRAGMARLLGSLNRFGQYILVIAFLTGGYMVSKHELSVPWMVVSVILIVIIFAMAGMLSKPLRHVKELSAQSKDVSEPLAKINTYGWIASIGMIAIIVLMTNPYLI